MILSKKVKNSVEQSLGFISFFLLKNCQNERNLIGLTGSYDNKKMKFSLCCKICEQLSQTKRVALVDLDCSEKLKDPKNFSIKYCESGISKTEFKKILDGFCDCDFVIVNVPCVLSNSNSLFYLEMCDKVFMVERYMYTKYCDYERSIYLLETGGVDVSGVISYD